MKKKLNVGSGQDVKSAEKGWTNLDLHSRHGAQVQFDLSTIEKGKKLPFKDEEFDYVLCSHVLEDFIDPIPIMDELVRITKVGGILDLRVPYETTTWDGIYHKKPFNVITFLSYVSRVDYEIPKMALKIRKIKFYHSKTPFKSIIFNPIFVPKRYLVTKLFNLMIKIKWHAVDYSILKYLSHNIFLQCIYQKTRPKK